MTWSFKCAPVHRQLLLKTVACLSIVSACLILENPARAQSSPNTEYLRKYIFIAPGSNTFAKTSQSAYAVGLGGEQLVGKGFGIGVDLSAVIPGAGKANTTVGSTSFNPYFHPIMRQNWDVFVTSGYSLVFRDFTANGFNFGAGTSYWFHENTGFTFELREEAAQHKPQFIEHHFLEFRIGLTFR